MAIGRLTYYKGHDILIQAAAELPGSRTLIVGTGEQRARLASLIEALRLGDRIGLPGFQPETDLNALLASCDVLCLPSLERTEAFGLVLLEAMRFGRARPAMASWFRPAIPRCWRQRCGSCNRIPPGGYPSARPARMPCRNDLASNRWRRPSWSYTSECSPPGSRSLSSLLEGEKSGVRGKD